MNQGFSPRPGSSGQKTMGLIHSNETHPVWEAGRRGSMAQACLFFCLSSRLCERIVSGMCLELRGGNPTHTQTHTLTHAHRNYIMFDLVRFLSGPGRDVRGSQESGGKQVCWFVSCVFFPPMLKVFIFCLFFLFLSCRRCYIIS